MTRVAAIDCGTNTIRLLIADIDPATGSRHELAREMRVVRLGQDVDRTGRLTDEALARVFAAIEEYAGLIDTHQIEPGRPRAIRFCATSAARDASNAHAFTEGVQQRLGVVPEVVTGAEEAQLSYAGATRSLHCVADVVAPILVVDIGGGSTELILGGDDGQVHAADSLNVGSVRMTERHLRSDPPTEPEIVAATADIDAALDGLAAHGVSIDAANTLIGVGGTVTTVAATVLDLPAYDRDRIDHVRLAASDVVAASRRLLGMTVAERRALPFMHPGRADVIGAGALILERIVRRSDLASLLVSEADILDGIAWSIA